jgi:phosphoribosylglycinamide formyltransferase-1
VPVLCHDTEQTLAARVLHEEHRIYPQAIRWLCTDQIELGADGKVVFLRRKQSAFSLISPGLE